MRAMVLDTTVLSHFARAGRLELLEHVLSAWTVVTTREVLGELREGAGLHPAITAALELRWVQEVRLADHQELVLFGEYSRRLGNSQRNIGERTVLAWAESHDAIAIIDDNVARQVARERNVKFRGTLWLLVSGVQRGLLTWNDAEDLVSTLRSIGARLPRTDDGGLEGWAQRNGIVTLDE